MLQRYRGYFLWKSVLFQMILLFLSNYNRWSGGLLNFLLKNGRDNVKNDSHKSYNKLFILFPFFTLTWLKMKKAVSLSP
jgi:hypothetical protein